MELGDTKVTLGLRSFPAMRSEQEEGWEKGSREEGCTEVAPGSCPSLKPVFPVPPPLAPRPPTRCPTSLHKKQLEKEKEKQN